MTYIPLTQQEWLEKLGPEKFLEVSSKLGQKKAQARKMIAGRKIKKDKVNGYDKYSYLSEAGYKALINDVFTSCGLELTSTELDTKTYEIDGSGQPHGCYARWAFQTMDIETGYYETAIVTGNGMDKGDKAIYKADTGAMKYFAANNWLVATGDDAEAESPDFISKEDKRKSEVRKLEQLTEEVTKIKAEAWGHGIDIYDQKIIDWIKEKSKTDGTPKNAAEAKRIIKVVQVLIDNKVKKDGKKEPQDEKVS